MQTTTYTHLTPQEISPGHNPYIENHIMVYDHFAEPKWCDSVVSYMKSLQSAGLSVDRQDGHGFKSHMVADDQMTFHSETVVGMEGTQDLSPAFKKAFWDTAYPAYLKKYGVLQDHETHGIFYLKAQKTSPTEGYHVWHCEQMTRAQSNRLLTFILYLNDVEAGGETEFLYQKARVAPSKGRFVLFPGSFTHTHRGNPPLSGDKYILTGWVEM